MVENKEIKALLQLIDDPDEEVFNTVSNRIISFGKIIIPNLEDIWEHSTNEALQERIAAFRIFPIIRTNDEKWGKSHGGTGFCLARTNTEVQADL